MKLRFFKFDPTGNTTILITSPVPRADQPRIAELLMAHENLCAEQVGFLEEPSLPGARARLQMAGGEFCGNASMSMAALLAIRGDMTRGTEEVFPLEVSGADGIVPCRILRRSDTTFTGTVGMPLPTSITEVALPDGRRAPLVRFRGIAHMLIPEDALTPSEAERLIPSLCDELNMEALGLLAVHPEPLYLKPLVYVRATRSAVWESGCGSGSAALSAYAAHRSQRDVSLEIEQPGGTIAARAAYDGGAIRKIEIRGNVRLAAQGEAYID